MLNVSPAQVGKIENIKHNAVDEIKEAVENGDMSIAVADSIAKLPEQEQEELISETPVDKITTKAVKERKEKTEKTSSKKSKENYVSDDDILKMELADDFEDEDLSYEITVDNDEEVIPDETEMYRSKLLEANAEFAELVKNAVTVQEIQRAAVEIINKITDIQTEVRNG